MKRYWWVIVLMIAGNALAQPNPDTLWTRTYGGSGFDEAHSIQQTTDGGYVIAGVSDSSGAGEYRIFAAKTNGQGDTIWTRAYGEGHYGDANFVRQSADGGFIVAGYITLAGPSDRDFYLVKTDGLGNIEWTWSVPQKLDSQMCSVSWGVGGCFDLSSNSTGDR